jgi:hypothetical protein
VNHVPWRSWNESTWTTVCYATIQPFMMAGCNRMQMISHLPVHLSVRQHVQTWFLAPSILLSSWRGMKRPENLTINLYLGPRLAQAVSRWLPTAAVRGLKPGRHVGFSPSTSVSPAKFIPPIAPKNHHHHHSQHGHSWHRAPLGPMAIYLFNVKTSAFLFLLSLFLLW